MLGGGVGRSLLRGDVGPKDSFAAWENRVSRLVRSIRAEQRP
jgi:hypothetical protein